jgi:ACR3 family arsenite efflux pump ArsB
MDLSRHQTALLIAGIVAGLGLSRGDSTLLGYSDPLLTGGLFTVLFSIMVTVSLERIVEAAKNLRFFLLAIATNFLAIPLLAFVLAWLFVGHEPAILLGLVMYLVTPCTDWFLAFTHQARGDIALGTVLLPWNLLLQIGFLPLYVLLISGTTIPVELADFEEPILLFFVLPLFLSRLVRMGITRTRGAFDRRASSLFSSLQTGALTFVVLMMFASGGREILENVRLFPGALGAVSLFFAVVFVLARAVSGIGGLSREEYILLHFTASARNSPVALAIALGTFPDQPLVAAVIVLGPLVELPILALEARYLGQRG